MQLGFATQFNSSTFRNVLHIVKVYFLKMAIHFNYNLRKNHFLFGCAL